HLGQGIRFSFEVARRAPQTPSQAHPNRRAPSPTSPTNARGLRRWEPLAGGSKVQKNLLIINARTTRASQPRCPSKQEQSAKRLQACRSPSAAAHGAILPPTIGCTHADRPSSKKALALAPRLPRRRARRRS